MKPKPSFVSHYKALLGKRYEEFISICNKPLRKSIRVNRLKICVSDCVKRLSKEWLLTKIPWTENGFWIEHKSGDRLDIGNTTEHMLGYYYVQEAASMIPAIVLEPKPGELVLDMCAAPGSKATQIAEIMNNKGVLIANDHKGKRIAALGLNLQRCGVSNAVITLMLGQAFKDVVFDKVLLDAPCSGTGAIRKSRGTFITWSRGIVKKLSNVQKSLIMQAFSVLKPSGVLVYSTCSLEPEENEAVVDYLLREFPNAKLLNIKLNLKSSSPILKYEGNEFNPEIKKCLRLWPQDNDTEGFFVSKIKKLN